jgi:beta-glucanase (GH16 family)
MTVRSEQPAAVLHTSSYATPDEASGQLVRGQGGGTTTLESSVATEYHDYAVEWGPERTDWFIDGELTHSFDRTAANIFHPDGQDPFTQPFHLKLSLAVGGLSEAPVAEDYPQEMRVDRLRVWQYGTE